ncbi:MAG: stage III sporulation protein AD [Clostridiaceae bacterium]|nr:stage III sporulation protein AD [Eubacteriales bacterium]
MTIFKIVGLALAALTAVLLLRAYRPELAVQAAVAAGVVLLLIAVTELSGVMAMIDAIVAKYGLSSEHIKVVLKVIGIAYLAQFAAQTCRDAGEGAIASKVELVGRVLIVTVAVPVVFSILDVLGTLLNAL